MLEKIEKLKKLVGSPYRMFFEDGNYCGCFFPVYELFPDAPKFPLPSDNYEHNFLYGLSKIKKNALEIKKEDLKPGDIVATKFNDVLHVAVYIGGDKVIHVFRGHTLQISRLGLFKHRLTKFFRVD